jgi:multiple sugar transport system substrate-binding protein
VKKKVSMSLLFYVLLLLTVTIFNGSWLLAKVPAKASNQITLMTIDTTFGPQFNDYIAKAEAATGIKINVVSCPTNPNDRQAKITTILSSGDNGIDIITVNDEMISAFKQTGFLEPLQKDVMNSSTIKYFPKEYVQDMLMVGKNIYSVPMYMEILVMWANQKLLDKAGMKAPASQAEFTKFVKAATGNGVYGYGGAWEKTYVFNEIGSFVNLFGGDYFNWKNPKSRAAVKFLHDMTKEGVTPKAQLADIYDPMMQKFFDEKYGIILMYTGAMQTFLDSGKYGPRGLHIIPMPKFHTSSAYMATWQYVLNKSSVNKAAAKKFLRYAATAQGERDYFAMSKRLPARSDVLNDPNFKADGLSEIKQYIAHTTLRGRPMVPQTMEFISGIGSLFQQYISDEITLDQFCKNAQKEVEKYKR